MPASDTVKDKRGQPALLKIYSKPFPFLVFKCQIGQLKVVFLSFRTHTDLSFLAVRSKM